MTEDSNSEIASRPVLIIVMGVSGSGKTTIGRLLAERLGWSFFDGDDFHPESNIEKMAGGVPLADEDRVAWLAVLHDLIADRLSQGQPAVLACSALKRTYRQQLLAGNDEAAFVYLRGEYALISQRMRRRSDHFFAPALLRSQFADLEEPTSNEALVVDIDQEPDGVVEAILDAVASSPG